MNIIWIAVVLLIFLLYAKYRWKITKKRSSQRQSKPRVPRNKPTGAELKPPFYSPDRNAFPDLEAQLRELATQAWTTEQSLNSQLLLNPKDFVNITAPTQIVEILIRHARRTTPGFNVPHMVPRILVVSMPSAAGTFKVDEEGWVTIELGANFFQDKLAAQAILAHEVCHYILENSGIRKSNVNLNERYTDLCMFVCGFGEIFLAGYRRDAAQQDYRPGHRLGYLTDAEYQFAQQYVIQLRQSGEISTPKELDMRVRERDRLWYPTHDDRPSLPQESRPSGNLSTEELIKHLGCVNNAESRRLAAEFLGQRGATAAPAISALLIACVDIDAIVRKAALNALETIDPSWTQSPEAQKALPKLAEAFKHSYCFKKSYSEDVSKAAYKLLQQIGKPAVPFLANLIVEEEDKIEYQIRAIWILRDLGSSATSAIPQLIQALSNKATRVRIAAAEALANFRFAAKAATPAIIIGLADRDIDVRNAMVACLVATEPAVPDLLPLMADQNPNVRRATADALLQIGPQTIPMLIQTVSQWCIKPKTDINNFEKLKFQRMTEAALHVLGKLGSDASSVKPTIALALVDPNLSIKFAAVQALVNLDHNWMSNPSVVEAMTNLAEPRSSAENPEDIVGEIIVQVFTEIGAASVPILIDALTTGDRVTRQNAARALGQIGAAAKAAIPALTRALEDNYSLVQYEAVRALEKINGSVS